MLTIPVLKLLIQIKTRGSAEKLPRKDLHSLLCLQLLGCRQEGKLFLLQHNSGEWKISPSWSLCKRPCDGQGGSLWTKKLSSGTGTTGGTSTETTGDIQSWDLQDWRQEKPATSTSTQMMFQRGGEVPAPPLALQRHLTWIKYCMGTANTRKDQTTWQPPRWMQALWEIQFHLGEKADSGDMCCSKPLRRSKWKTRMLALGKTRRTGSLEEGTKVSTAVL